MPQPPSPRIAVVGDRYMPATVFTDALARIGVTTGVTAIQLDDAYPVGEAAPTIREYVGDPAHVAEAVRGHDVLVIHAAPVTAEVLAAGDDLALICCARGGPVNIDLAVATERGVLVVGAPGKNADAVADLTLAFMLMLARRIPSAMAAFAATGRMGDSVVEGAQYMGSDLPGKTLGLIGYGNVGRRVARRALGFGMSVMAHDPLVPGEALAIDGVRPAGLDELLGTGDFISLHARATPETADLIGAERLAAMRPDAFLINTARETLVDEGALHRALADGAIAGAALDVLRPHDGPGPNPLLGLERLIVTPHIGGATHDTLSCGAQMAAAEVDRYRRGKPPLHPSNEIAHTGSARA